MITHRLYWKDIEETAGLVLPWDKLRNSRMLVSGASGLIGTFFVDTIMYKNRYHDLNCHMYAIGPPRST